MLERRMKVIRNIYQKKKGISTSKLEKSSTYSNGATKKVKSKLISKKLQKKMLKKMKLKKALKDQEQQKLIVTIDNPDIEPTPAPV